MVDRAVNINPNTLANICAVAAERFKNHAKEFCKLIDYKPKANTGTTIDMIPHGEGARRLAEQFELQAKEAEEYAAIFAEADTIKVS
ncbi:MULTISPECIES: hypothetical protein [unclassified Mesorhizobium]|uniref:hypothetical protein n=1 Tax=unclassified Mesorhizobium TaxID=325217 RepID=UPI00112AB88B|nr:MULTISPECIES: hypothetical protein [unclassified Mesorhizobium]TPJ51770.1 hypothetical protein FJ426_18875 [Mesorhizobium sp. B2-6-4]TPN42392.1 hypothetical protein FJ979_02290 [Mesorhizobium sp. B1-1-6]